MIKDYIKNHKIEMLEDLTDLIAIPSVSDDGEKVAEALRKAVDIASKHGFRAKSLLDDQVGIAEMGEGEETLGILTHVDVVPTGDMAEWHTDPYGGEIINGRIYGRGTQDDKGMLIASLYAMRAVRDLGLPLHKKVQLIIGTQEEVEWTDMDEYVKYYPLPDYGFTPDGAYPICNIEKGFIDHTMEFTYDTGEGDGVRLAGLDIGTAANVVPGKATAVLSDGRTITVRGKACHSSQPEFGVNALILLGEKLRSENLEPNGLLDLLNAVCDDFEDFEGGSLGLRSESEYYQGEFVHRNVLSPTILKAKDGRAELTINVRFAYGENMERIIRTLGDWAAARGGRTLKSDAQPAVFVSKERPFLKAFAEAYEEVSGLKNDFTLEYGGTYAKAMPNIVSWGPIFPDEEDTCHQPDEYIGIDSLLMSAEIFAEAIAKIVLSEESFK